MLTRKRFFDFTVTLESQPVRLHIKRMTVPEFAAFEAKFLQIGEGRGAPVMTGEATTALLDAEVAHLRRNAEWQSEVFDQFVSVLPGQVFDEDEHGGQIEVTNGRQLADMFPGDPAMAEILLRIYIDNRLTEDQKKRLRSPSDSGTGSTTELSPVAVGQKPAPAATNAADEASASHGAAMERSSNALSGTTDRSSSVSAPCAI